MYIVGAELAYHPRLAALFEHLNIFQSFTWLGEYGSSRTATPKPIRLWSNSKFISDLRRTAFIQRLLIVESSHLCVVRQLPFGNVDTLKPPAWFFDWGCRRRLRRHRYHRRNGLVSHYYDRAGRLRFKGLAKLKLSQAYPIGFARAVTQPTSLGGKSLKTKACLFTRHILIV